MKSIGFTFLLLNAGVFYSPEAALAENKVSPALEAQILEHVWSLRKDRHLPDLSPNPSLDRIALQATTATLERGPLSEKGSAGVTPLEARTKWEDYRGCTKEITARVSRLCAEASGDAESYGRSVGEEMKALIRKSSQHYRGLISATKKPWNEFGFSIQDHQETVDGQCTNQIVMTLVLGLDRPLRANEL
jgi:hypothetical protein